MLISALHCFVASPLHRGEIVLPQSLDSGFHRTLSTPWGVLPNTVSTPLTMLSKLQWTSHPTEYLINTWVKRSNVDIKGSFFMSVLENATRSVKAGTWTYNRGPTWFWGGFHTIRNMRETHPWQFEQTSIKNEKVMNCWRCNQLNIH